MAFAVCEVVGSLDILGFNLHNDNNVSRVERDPSPFVLSTSPFASPSAGAFRDLEEHCSGNPLGSASVCGLDEETIHPTGIGVDVVHGVREGRPLVCRSLSIRGSLLDPSKANGVSYGKGRQGLWRRLLQMLLGSFDHGIGDPVHRCLCLSPDRTEVCHAVFVGSVDVSNG